MAAGAQWCPIKCPIERLEILCAQPLATFSGPLIHAEGEGRIAVAQLFCDIDRIVTQRCTLLGIGAAQRVGVTLSLIGSMPSLAVPLRARSKRAE
jgi:hypothetical protein